MIFRLAKVLLISALLFVSSAVCVLCGWTAFPFETLRAFSLGQLKNNWLEGEE